MKTHYEVLGVAKDASAKDIKTAYRKLAMQYHPDRNKEAGADDKIKEVNEAYDILSNEKKKTEYDHIQQYGGQPGRGPGGPGGPFQNQGADFGDIFNQMFGNAHRAQQQQRQQQKQVYQAKLTLADAFTGTSMAIDGRNFNIPRGVRTGNRMYIDDKIIEIFVLPHVKFKRSGDDLLVDITITAIEAMMGMDATISDLKNSKLKFKIPSGIQPGGVIKLGGKGMPNPEYDKVGDLLIRCNITIPKLTSEEKQCIISINRRNTIEI